MRAETGAEEQFGPYLVYERLGVGGMATVHRALERGIEGFERVVALKRLLPHLAADASFIKSFVREAKLASLLNHVNIVQIFECGRVGAQYFISMEYIDGRDIRRILRHARKTSGPPPIHVTVGLLLQLCDALDYAHGRQDESGHPLGLVHRDVSPSNVLVTTTGHVKVIDFGIAKAQSAQLRTQTGRVKGKLAYMAPEALVGKELDARSDLFAAGIICHELLTARPLFATKNDYQTLSKIQRGDIMPPSTFNQLCPPELDAIVLRALARDPDERFLHASELREELLGLRKQYNLKTSDRDIAGWLDWAFGLEGPTDPHRASLPRASSKTEIDVQPAGSAPAERPSRPKRSDEEEAMEIAWGPGDDHDNGEPVVLDDVPDVTDKHLDMESSLGAEVRLDLDDLADDIPTPIPSGRGTSDASQRAVAAALLAKPAPRVKRPTPAIPLRNASMPAPPAPSSAASAAAPAGAVPVAASSVGSSGVSSSTAAARSSAIPPVVSSAASAALARGRSPSPTPPRAVPSGSIAPLLALGRPRPRSVTAPGTGPQRPGTGPKRPDALPRPDTQNTGPTTLFAADSLALGDAPITDRTPAYSLDDLGLASDTIVSIPQMEIPTLEPIVRFREPSTPPPDSRMITPATALFADPEPDTNAEATPIALPTTVAIIEHDARPRRRPTGVGPASAHRPFWRMAAVLVALALVGAAVTAGALQLWRNGRAAVEVAPPTPPSSGKATGTIELTVTPADSTITVEGKPAHAGSPWSIDLAPGVYQLEVHHDGYMGWLTSVELSAGVVHPLRVALEPLGATTSDATIIIGPTPALDVLVDGEPSGKTPLKRALPPGSHTIVLRRGTTEVWRKTLDAQANAVYELRPAIAPPAVRPDNAAPSATPPAPSAVEPSTAPPAAASDPSAPAGASPAPAADPAPR